MQVMYMITIYENILCELSVNDNLRGENWFFLNIH